MYALFNFNDYLGGGETIFVRWAEFLLRNNIECRLFYAAKGFVADAMNRLQLPRNVLCPYDGDANYYYQTENERKAFVDWIEGKLEGLRNVKLISFCMRDLYTLVDVSRRNSEYTITHLILHDQDNLYVCQTLYDKFLLKCRGVRNFSDKRQLEFNNQLVRDLVGVGGLIAEKMTTKIVMRQYGVDIDDGIIVPPPMCNFSDEVPEVHNNKRIVWVGRVVDFKLPAICSMLDFVCRHKEYRFTIIGDGEIDFLKKYVKDRSLDDSNVDYRGIVSYDKIPDVIKEHSIGYACGTSIVEIGRWGLPVITALASPDHVLFKRSICGGIYNNKYKGNEGNNLFIGETEDEQPTIEDTIGLIEDDFRKAASQSYQAMKEDFDLIANIKNYHRIIDGAKRMDVLRTRIPFSPVFRRLVFRHLYK